MKHKKLIFVVLVIALFTSSFGLQKGKDGAEGGLKSAFQVREVLFSEKGPLFLSQGPRYAPGEVLVKFKPDVTELRVAATIAAYGSRTVKRIPRIDVHKIRIPEGVAVEQMVYILNQNPDVVYAEPDYIARLAATPNDTYFQYQYALSNSGQPIGIPGSPQGKARADIKATTAWEETKGNETTLIAILDTGVDHRHPDIKNKIKSTGRDFANNDLDAMDDHGHGTHIAGIAAAETDNREGIAGVAWNCKVLPVKVMDKEGSGLYSWIIEGIIWAADNGAHVINLSLGGDEPSTTLLNALKYAFDKKTIVVAATGNDAAAILYPAAYDAYCLAVAATDYNDARWTWSNFGPEVDVAAPGERIISLVPLWYPEKIFGDFKLPPYGYGSGTSMAVPHVSGLAALLKSHKPWLKPEEIMDIIRFSADDVNSTQRPGKDDFIGYGRINMEKALAPIKIKK